MWALLFILAARSAYPMDPALVNEGVGKVFDAAYDEAEIYFERGLADQPAYLRFFKEWLNYSIHKGDKMGAFEQEVEAEITNYQRAQSQNPDSLLLEGMWNGLLALCWVDSGDLLPAYRNGRYAYEVFRKALTLDPEKYDAYFGLGLYHKMKFELSSEAWFVPTSARDLSLAKKYFSQAIEKGLFTRELAESFLLELPASEPESNPR